MTPPDTPENESARQAALERYEILDSLPERAYDDVTALMAQVCDAPISLVSLLDRDRNWLKSHHGVALDESPRELSFCGHAIVSGEEVFVVEDARADPRFADNPLVTEHAAISYAGAPLVDADGFALGTLCVFDNEPRRFDDAQRAALAAMARQVMHLLERHLRERRLEQAGQELTERNDELKRFAGIVSHDLKSPATNIAVLADLLESDNVDALSAESLEYLRHLRRSSQSLRGYVDGLLEHYTSDDLLRREPEPFALAELFAALDAMTVREADVEIIYPTVDDEVCTHRAALLQVLANLVANAVKYCHDEPARISIDFEERDVDYRFGVTDNGPGIAPERQASIFGLFTVGGHLDRHGAQGSGIGLATVSKLVERLGGVLELDSVPGRGSAFSFTLPKGDALRNAA